LAGLIRPMSSSLMLFEYIVDFKLATAKLAHEP